MNNALVLGVVLSLSACGGKKDNTTPDPQPVGDDNTNDVADNNNNMGDVVTPETLDQIQKMFQRKGGAVSRCLAVIVDNKELPKNSKGRITLEVQISPSGTPGDIKILSASIDHKPLHECILAKVKEIQFPQLPKVFPATYTYSFEAM